MKNKKYKKALWIAVITLLVVFTILALLMRQSVRQISKDPSVTSITNESVFRVIQIFNTNKNRGEGCWNMKSPFLPCEENNEIIKGDYALRGTKDAKWLEGPVEGRQQLSEDFLRETMGGFMIAGETYWQTIVIKYPNSETVQIEVTTQNGDGDTSTRIINLNAK